MLASGIKSKPIYSPLRADTRGRYHLMLGRGPGGVALLRVLGELKAAAPALLKDTRVLFVPDAAPDTRGASNSVATGVAVHESAAPNSTAIDALRTVEQLRQMGPAGVQPFPDATALLSEFRSVLDQSLMGTRLYVAGPESFIGLAMRIALEFNLNKDEIRAEEMGTLARRVYCVHCRTTTEEVRTNIVRCIGCERWLLVRDHYSRRLAAYMGVMVDAEAPGELPSIQEVYS
jgi:dimethylamine monooxygenase subunit C